MPVRPDADIIVCVHNSPEDVSLCIASVIPSLAPGDRLILVDDGSAERTRLICAEAAEAHPEAVVLLRRPTGSGFCRAANAGLRLRQAPIVVLLNSDTIVLPGWLDRIAACFGTNPAIGVVGPLSNAGGWQSVPGFGTGGGPPNSRIRKDAETLEQVQAFCSSLLGRFDYPILEQVNGFCLAIRAEVLDEIGLLDEAHFPMGYGEEADFNFRAQDAGWLCAIAIDCFVYHDKTKSYSTKTREALIREGRANVDRLHGTRRVGAAVEASRAHPTLNAIRAEAKSLFLARGWVLPEE